MDRFVEMVAPRGWIDGVIKVSASTALFLGCNLILHLLFPPASGVQSLVYEMAMAGLVGLPFIIFGFLVMARLYQLKREMRDLANHDPLTGLPNRRHFLAATQTLCNQGVSGVFMAMDADHFKSINDDYGHQVGDAYLVRIADHLRGVLRSEDLKARLGGEEFAAFFPHMTLEQAALVADRVIQPIRVRGADTPSLTLSVGMVDVLPGMRITEIYRRADEALYAAKKKGRARAECWPVSEPDTPKRGEVSRRAAFSAQRPAF